MKLTAIERATLIMLHKILKNLEPENKKEHTNAIEILEDGYYEMWENECLGHLSQPLEKEKMNYVHDILGMYWRLQDSYKDLSDGDKKKVGTEDTVIFEGFDGNNETELLSYARFLMERFDKWSGVKATHDLNTHAPTGRRYSAMLEAMPSSELRHLSAEQINTVLKAQFINII
ncbi:MAG: YfbU family protein [Patescibacteria group bacterium]